MCLSFWTIWNQPRILLVAQPEVLYVVFVYCWLSFGPFLFLLCCRQFVFYTFEYEYPFVIFRLSIITSWIFQIFYHLIMEVKYLYFFMRMILKILQKVRNSIFGRGESIGIWIWQCKRWNHCCGKWFKPVEKETKNDKKS